MTRVTRRQVIALTSIVVLSALAIVGYRYWDRTPVRIQQAVIALSGSHPDQALAIADAILAKQPHHADALRVKARALSRLGRPLDQADVLRQLIDLQPDLQEHHDSLVDWTFQYMERLLTAPDFTTNSDIQTEFDRAMSTGLAQVEWYRKREPSSAASFLHARYIMADLYRLRTMESDPATRHARLDQAIKDLTLVISTEPNHAAARYLLAQANFQKGNLNQSQDILIKLTADQPQSVPAKALLIRTYLRMNNLQTARRELAAAIELSPRDADLLGAQMTVYQRAQDRSAVRAMVERIKNVTPLSDAHRIVLADGLLYLQDPQDQRELRTLLTYLHENHPANASVNVLRAKFYLQRNRPDMAADILARITRVDPDDHYNRLLYAQALAGMERTDEALTEFVRIPVDSGVNLHGRAQLCLLSGQLDDAQTFGTSALASNMNDPAIRLLLAGILHRKNDPDSAVYQLEMFIRNQPTNPLGYALLSRLFWDQKKVDDGLQKLQELEVFNEPLAVMAEAWLMGKTQQYEAALDRLAPIYQQLVSNRDPMALPAADALAAVFLQRKRIDDAIHTYDALVAANLCPTEARLRQIDLSPSDEKLDTLAERVDIRQPRLVYSILVHYDRQHRYDRALRLLDRWIRQRPDQAVLLEWKGKFLLKTNQPEDAARAFRTAIELEPENLELWQGLVQTYLTKKDFARAEAVYLDMAKIDPAARVHALAELARVYVIMGLTDRATDILHELSRSATPRDPHVLLTLGQVSAALDRPTEAREYLSQIPKSSRYFAPAQAFHTANTIQCSSQ